MAREVRRQRAVGEQVLVTGVGEQLGRPGPDRLDQLAGAEVQEVTRHFAQIPRAGEEVYGFVAGLYPTDAPTPPEAEHAPTED